MKKFIYLLLIPLCMGFGACGSDNSEPEPEPVPTPTPSPQQQENADLIGWWKVNFRDTYNVRGVHKSSFRSLHIINELILEVIDLTEEEEWFPGEKNDFAVDINGTNFYYLNRSMYACTIVENTITLPKYPYSNNVFLIKDNKIIRDSETYYKVK